MVLWHKNTHVFNRDFRTVSLAFFNRYPNPYSTHVLSIDTLSSSVDQDGRLYTTRLIKKEGKLPTWVKPFLGRISESWILELSLVDPIQGILHSYTRNLDHTRIITVEEYSDYRFDSTSGITSLDSRVKFTSAFRMGIKNRIEEWSHRKFDEHIKLSRQGLTFVMDQIDVKLAL